MIKRVANPMVWSLTKVLLESIVYQRVKNRMVQVTTLLSGLFLQGLSGYLSLGEAPLHSLPGPADGRSHNESGVV